MPVTLPGTPHTAKIALGWLNDNQQMESIFYVQDTSDSIFADPAGFLGSVATKVVTDLLPQMFADLVFNQIGFEDVRTVPFGGLTLGLVSPSAGSLSATAPLPLNVTLSVKKNTGNLGRSGRGRMYWPSLDPSVLIDDNHIDPGYISDVLAALDTFQADVESISGSIDLGIVSYFLNSAVRTSGLFQAIINFSCVDNVCDSMRKRLPGRGR